MTESIIKGKNISWIPGFIWSGIIGWRMSTLLIDWLKTKNQDIRSICRHSSHGELILILISMFLLGVLIYSIYSFIVSIGNADTLRNSLLLVYHVAAFSAMLNIFLFVGLLEIIVSLVLAALSYVIHINTYGDRYYSILNKKTLLFSAICYGISASLMLNALASEYIMNTSAYVLGFMLVFVISFVTLFFKSAVKHAL